MGRGQLARTAIVVLGMHRAGTSALAGLLNDLGLTPPSDPLPPHPDNPKGYVEPISAVEANEAMLAEAGSSWFDLADVDAAFADAERRHRWVESARASLLTSFGAADAIVLKEPRINRLWPIWRDALQAEGFAITCVFAGRDPAEVARSIHTRDGCALAYAGALWLRHTVAAEAASRAFPRAVVDYGDLIADPAAVAQRLSALAGLAVAPDAAAGIDPGLRRATADVAKTDDLFIALSQVHDAFCRLADADGIERRDDFAKAAEAAERAFDADALVRGEMLRLWPEARLANKKLVNWRRRARKAEARISEIGQPLATPTDRFAAIPEAVVARVRDSGLFDADWYVSRYPDVASAGVDPIRHYLAVGAALGHDPGPLFQTDLYARQMADADGKKT